MDMKKSDRKTRWIDCYNSSQKILLVGEGDFSFSACLARAFRTAKNIIATSYLDEDSLVEKHWTGIPHLKELESLGCVLLYEVDVYDMDTHPILKKSKFDIIIFNFPHAGHYHYLRETNLQLIEMHRELVGGFFRSASKMLSEGGEVHIRHRDDYPYDRWGVVSLAGEVAGLRLKEKVLFDKSEYPGYLNKRGGDIQTNKKFPIGYAFTFKFVLDDLPKINNDQVCGLELKDGDDHAHVVEMNDNDVDHMKNHVHVHDHDDIYVHMFEGLCLEDHDDVDNGHDDKDKDNDDDDYRKYFPYYLEDEGFFERYWL